MGLDLQTYGNNALRLSTIRRHLCPCHRSALLLPATSNVGGSIWDCSQGSFGVAGPYLACLAFASVFVCSLYMVHTTLACLSVGLLNDRPSRWDPAIMTWPWSSTSVAELWAKRWHQYLRGHS